MRLTIDPIHSVFSMLTCMLWNHPCKQLLKVNKTYSMTLLIQKFSIRLFFKPKLELKVLV